LAHDGEWGEAAKDLAKRGFGRGKRPPRKESLDFYSPEDEPVKTRSLLPEEETEVPPYYSPEAGQAQNWAEPCELIHGVLHQGSKGMIAGPSKARKTFLLIDLALSVATGSSWLGWKTTKTPVLYLNLELANWAFQRRLNWIMDAKGLDNASKCFTWHLRGYRANFRDLFKRIETFIKNDGIGMVIIDPVYKLDQGVYDENTAKDVGQRLTDFEEFCRVTGAAMVFAHHFAKGNSAAKVAEDRASGSGVWARDPDALLSMTPHSDDDDETMVIESRLRNHISPSPFTIEWDNYLWKRSEKPPVILDRNNKKGTKGSEVDKTELVTALGKDIRSRNLKPDYNLKTNELASIRSVYDVPDQFIKTAFSSAMRDVYPGEFDLLGYVKGRKTAEGRDPLDKMIKALLDKKGSEYLISPPEVSEFVSLMDSRMHQVVTEKEVQERFQILRGEANDK
jgi:hypothetical protein